jgi:hypothetical protein
MEDDFGEKVKTKFDEMVTTAVSRLTTANG